MRRCGAYFSAAAIRMREASPYDIYREAKETMPLTSRVSES